MNAKSIILSLLTGIFVGVYLIAKIETCGGIADQYYEAGYRSAKQGIVPEYVIDELGDTTVLRPTQFRIFK